MGSVKCLISTGLLSFVGMVILVIWRSFFPWSTVLLGAMRFRMTMALAGRCSAVISAACHPPEKDTDAALQMVMWGVSSETGYL